MIGGLMKSRKIMITVSSIVALLSIGGCTVEHKEDAEARKKIQFLHQPKKQRSKTSRLFKKT